eukprot:3666052-Pyramimonas_sp.AAC.1
MNYTQKARALCNWKENVQTAPASGDTGTEQAQGVPRVTKQHMADNTFRRATCRCYRYAHAHVHTHTHT